MTIGNKGTSATVLSRFLEMAACPICGDGLLLSSDSRLVCPSNEHTFTANEWEFFEFATKEQRDKYEAEDLVQQYVGFAYGYRLINTLQSDIFVGSGQSEGLYRSISQLALSFVLRREAARNTAIRIVDVACGVGRTVADLATLLPGAFVMGFDFSRSMIKCAVDILLRSGDSVVDLRKSGFGTPVMQGYGLTNVFLAQANAAKLPLKRFDVSSSSSSGFDIVINNMLIDRMQTYDEIEESLLHSADILRPGGALVFASPLNWTLEKSWEVHGRSRSGPLHFLIDVCSLRAEETFDGLVYRELMDPHGTHLELPVLVSLLSKDV